MDGAGARVTATRATPAQATGPNLLRPLRVRDFRLMFAGESISVVGDQFHFIALAWLTLQLTGSGFALGSVLMVAAIPRAVFMLLGGALSDRFSPRSLMLYTNIIRSILVGIIAALVLTGRAELWQLYLMAGIFGVVDAFFYPAISTILPMLVDEATLSPANALMQGSQQLAGLIGPVLAGALVGLWSTGPAFVVDSISFAVAAIALFFVLGGRRRAPTAISRTGAGRSLFGTISAGLAYAWSDAPLRALILLIAAFNFAFSGPLLVGLPFLADHGLGGGSVTFGLLLSAFGAGAVLGAVAAGSLHRVPHLGTIVLGIGVGLGLALSLIGLAPNVPVAFGLLAALGAGGGFLNVQVMSWLQARTAAEMRGRVMSLVLLGAIGLAPLSYAVAGVVLDLGRRPYCSRWRGRSCRGRPCSASPQVSPAEWCMPHSTSSNGQRQAERRGRLQSAVVTPSPSHRSAPWWAGAVIYQVYARSFADANGDGIGDLPGLMERLDHLAGTDASLGVDAVWLSPVFPSPLADYGYDIADFEDVAPEYGTLADLDRLVAACHARGLRLLLDLVPCHTSVQHPWFTDARSSRASPKRDWYTWADPGPGGGPPNNWRAAFGGASWELDPGTGQYYLHSFYPEQPDLNWRNPAVADAIVGVLRFWLARGVDGFRVDAIDHAMKDPLLRDNPPAGSPIPPFPPDRAGQNRIWTVDLPEVLDVVHDLRRAADEYPGRLLLGEAYLPVDRLARYIESDNGFQRAFDFELSVIAWGADPFSRTIERAERFTPSGVEPTWALSNHDLVRHATRFGERRARLAALILLSLRGTICLYAGEEIGMVDAPARSAAAHDRAGRDAQRTPMQWDASPMGGFTSGRPWLPLVDPAQHNVASQSGDPGSLLNLYRRLLALRRSSAAMRHGTMTVLADLPPGLLAWTREAEDDRLLVIANMGDATATVDLGGAAARGEVLCGTGKRGGSVELGELQLDPREGLLLRL